MAEYITRSDAIKAVNGQNAFTMTRGALIDALNDIPAVDVVPVVRCEKCAFSQLDGWICNGTGLMPQHRTFPNSFCSDGAISIGGDEGASL